MPLFRKKETLKDFQYMQDKALKEPLYSVAKLNQPNYNFNNNTFYRKITWNVELRMPNIHTNQLYLFDNSDGNPFLFTLERMSMISTVCFIHKKNKKKRCAKLWIKDLTKAYKSIWEINEAVPLYHMNYDIVKMRLDLVEHVSSVLNNRYNSAVLRAEYPPNYNSPSTPLPPKYSSPAPKYSLPAPMYRLTPPSSPLDEDGLPAVSPRSNITNEGGRKKTRRITRKIKRKATRRRRRL